jgi:UDP-N-acetylmuramoyl-L-alanyl-D-glutamate--2,6-diaminopimelate ligase
MGDSSTVVFDVRQDSRLVRRGDLFAARRGARASGVDFVRDAVDRGAAAVMAEPGTLRAPSVPVLEVSDIRRGIALAAHAVHGHPTRDLAVVGITGTNGKTTTSFLVEHVLGALGERPARLGTLGWSFGAERDEGGDTTPAAPSLARYAAVVHARKGTHLVMEVSSHALEQARVAGVQFKVAAFTNLTQDHLDYHGSIEAYGAAKLRLFTEFAPEKVVINVDDAFGRRILEACSRPVLRVSRGADGDVRPLDVSADAQGIRGTFVLPSGKIAVESRLIGEHNLDNVLLTLGIIEALGLDAARAASALRLAPGVPGRLERCDVPLDDIVVLVDYAHTPDALSRVLAAVQKLAPGRVTCVFGCGGDRDADKRPVMGQAVGRMANRVIVTSDNPRSEDPLAIVRAIEPGLAAERAEYEVELDRAQAIERAVLGATSGDVVLVAGKGHEPYQIIGEQRHRLDDRVEVRRALALRRDKAGR